MARFLRLGGAVALLALSAPLHAQERLPIIDMHLHASRVADFAVLGGPPPIPHCVPMTDYPIPDAARSWAEIFKSRDLPCRAFWSPSTDADVMEQTIAIMKRRNAYGVISGPQVALYKEAGGDRVIPGLSFSGGPNAPAVEAVRRSLTQGGFAVLGEFSPQYGGLAPDDPSLAPYWALAEELDVPVAIHIGTGPVGAPYLAFGRYRARLHSALLLEEVLVRHPKLRVSIMHAGWPMLDDLLAVLWTHPQVYVDLGAIDWALPRAEFHRYLRRIVEAGFGKRVLFGSDQMVWPDAMEAAIESIESADFLTAEQKRDIFFDNAARFLRLSPQRVAAMHGKAR